MITLTAFKKNVRNKNIGFNRSKMTPEKRKIPAVHKIFYYRPEPFFCCLFCLSFSKKSKPLIRSVLIICELNL